MSTPDQTPEVLLVSQERFSGRLIRITVDRVRLDSGLEAEREVVHHPGGVGVVALAEDGSVVLVRQYRHPAKESLWEIPAGGREVGESPLETARRELAEETGYAAESWLGVGATFLAPGYSTELLWYFRATDQGGGPCPPRPGRGVGGPGLHPIGAHRSGVSGPAPRRQDPGRAGPRRGSRPGGGRARRPSDPMSCPTRLAKG
jgi:hypothetical protein